MCTFSLSCALIVLVSCLQQRQGILISEMMHKAMLLAVLVAVLAVTSYARVAKPRESDNTRVGSYNFTLSGFNFTYGNEVKLSVNNMALTGVDHPVIDCTPRIDADEKWFNMTRRVTYPNSTLVLNVTLQDKLSYPCFYRCPGNGQEFHLTANSSASEFFLHISFSTDYDDVDEDKVDKTKESLNNMFVSYSVGEVSLKMSPKSNFLKNKPEALKAFTAKLSSHSREVLQAYFDGLYDPVATGARLSGANRSLRQLFRAQCGGFDNLLQTTF